MVFWKEFCCTAGVYAGFLSRDTRVQGLFDPGTFKQAIAIGNKYATQRIFGVEGISP
jgi:hypothetical protein